MRTHRIRIAVAISTLAILLGGLPFNDPNFDRPAYADDSFSISAVKDGKADSSRTSLDFGALNVGDKRTENVLISNSGDRNLVFLIYSRYSYLSKDGQTRIITSLDSKPYGMAAWALFGSKKAAAFTFSVAVGKSVVVPLEILVAKDAYPGDHSAAIVVQTTSGTGTVVVGKRVAMYMSSSISGTLKTAVNPSWINNSTFYEMNIRQYSTTKNFTGAAARLKDLKTLGVEALIVNPIFPIGKSKLVGTLGSIFATTDLSQVNPSLGTLTNFKSFMTSAKAAGLKVILKVPLDTAAIDHVWATTQSNWFNRNSDYDLVPVPSKAYLAYYDYSQEELQQSIIEDLKSWVLDADIDGYIFTGATDVPLDFLNELTYRLQTTKGLVIGTTDEVDSSYFKNNLTLTSNGELLKSLTSISKGTSTKAQLTTLLNSQVFDFKAPVLALNHLSSYETMEGGRTETSRLGAGLKIASMLTFTLPGAPVIFQGQEIANITALKPFDSSNIAWPTKTPTAFAEYEKLVALKTANSALFNEKYGGTSTVLTTTSNSLFAFSRKLSSNTVLVVVNLSNKALTAKFDSGVTATMYKYSDNKSVKMISKGYELTLPALSFEIFTNAIVK